MRFVQLTAAMKCPLSGSEPGALGEAKRSRAAEIAAVNAAIEIGYRLIDTAEMYGDGGAEEVVGAAIHEAMQAGTVSRERA